MRSVLLLAATVPSAMPAAAGLRSTEMLSMGRHSGATQPPEGRDNRSSFLALGAVPSTLHPSINQSGAGFENGYICSETGPDIAVDAVCFERFEIGFVPVEKVSVSVRRRRWRRHRCKDFCSTKDSLTPCLAAESEAASAHARDQRATKSYPLPSGGVTPGYDTLLASRRCRIVLEIVSARGPEIEPEPVVDGRPPVSVREPPVSLLGTLSAASKGKPCLTLDI